MEWVRRRCDFVNGIEVDSEGTRGRLCLAWKTDVNIVLQSYSKRHIDAVIGDAEVRFNWRYTGFYGSLYVHDRSDSWAVLKGLKSDMNLHWIVCGDFNEIYIVGKKMEAYQERNEGWSFFEELWRSANWTMWDILVAGLPGRGATC